MAQLALNVKKKLPRDGGMANLAGGGGSGSGGGPGKATSMNGLPTTGAWLRGCENLTRFLLLLSLLDFGNLLCGMM